MNEHDLIKFRLAIQESGVEIMDTVFQSLPDESDCESNDETVRVYGAAVARLSERLAIAERVINETGSMERYNYLRGLAGERLQ
ncbi:MAG: hypothetical protein KDK27_21185 [Leptospiraceae bacterium]|nr:hypothetical protein [Leptospiraceae bacterium]